MDGLNPWPEAESSSIWEPFSVAIFTNNSKIKYANDASRITNKNPENTDLLFRHQLAIKNQPLFAGI